jgi:4-hydroxybenzoate polyprenyltransferase
MKFLKLLRINQWVKNILIFSPLFFAHEYNTEKIYNLIFLFFCFSSICSAVYIFNDLVDLDSDRKHPTKKNRPLAFGSITKKQAIYIGIFLLIASTLVTYIFFSFKVILIYLLYIFLNILYFYYFKKKFIFDILFLTSFFIIRILVGSLGSGIDISLWLILCSFFFFNSLASLKRANEVLKYSELGNFGKIYTIKHFILLKNIFLYSLFITILVFSFYINSSTAESLYENLIYLWMIPFLLLIFTIVLNNQLVRKEINDDPTIHIFVSKKILIILLFILFFTLLAYTT